LTTGERITRLRKNLGLSADALGEMIGKDRSTIYRYERGDIENATIDVIPRLARALQTTPQHILGWEEKPAFYWIEPVLRTKLSDLAEQGVGWTLDYSWTEEEFELFAQHAKYILRIKGTDEYEKMMDFLATFYKQLNK
jgi:transcriptional regulator with XRE-family HTH domain